MNMMMLEMDKVVFKSRKLKGIPLDVDLGASAVAFIY